MTNSTSFDPTAPSRREEERSHPGSDLSLLFASVDSIASVGSLDLWKNKDLTNLFASFENTKWPLGASKGNDANPFASIDAVAGLISAANPHTIVPQVFASRDGIFASIDPLSFKSLDHVPLSFKSLDYVVPPPDTKSSNVGIYESREWLQNYEGSHTDIAYGKELFRASQLAPIKAKRSKWDEAYHQALQVPGIQPAPEAHQRSQTKITLKKIATKKKSLSKRGEPKKKIYVEPKETDVISGRGGKSNGWPGNERYRAAIEDAKPAYRAGAKFEKTIKSQEVVELLLSEKRRFLKLEESGPNAGSYYLMTKNQARKKTGQALREENTPESRRKKRAFYANRNGKQHEETA